MPPKTKPRNNAKNHRISRQSPRGKPTKGRSSSRADEAISGPAIFSQEISDLFIDYNHDDRQFLQTCSRVCRGWVASSRFHLLKGVVVTIDKSTELGWMNLVRSPLSTIGHHVRSVKLAASHHGALRYEHCIQRLDRIETLHILEGTITEDSFSPLFANVTTLQIESNVPDLDTILAFLASFTQLRDVRLRHTTREYQQYDPAKNMVYTTWEMMDPPTVVHSMPSSLAAVSLTWDSTIGIFNRWFSQQTVAPNIRELELSVSSRHKYTETSTPELLQHLKPTLRSLTIQCVQWLDSLHLLDLDNYPCLETLCIHVSKFFCGSSYIHWLCQRTTRHLAFILNTPCCIWIQEMEQSTHFQDIEDWQRLDQALSGSSFKKIEFRWEWKLNRVSSDIVAFLQRNLPLCDAKGVLEISSPAVPVFAGALS
ncbi:hypothetical protein C8J56DRAFT_252505 [Mycena floridula]|nr:hypothetical protein C8J56DRAFT_252505 [Mycena floridula]